MYSKRLLSVDVDLSVGGLILIFVPENSFSISVWVAASHLEHPRTFERKPPSMNLPLKSKADSSAQLALDADFVNCNSRIMIVLEITNCT